MFVKRDQQGEIVAMSLIASDEINEAIDSDSSELRHFFAQFPDFGKTTLQQSDADFIRVLDDLIMALTQKRLIQFTDLPLAAQKKLLTRVALRESNNNLNLLVDDEEETIHI